MVFLILHLFTLNKIEMKKTAMQELIERFADKKDEHQFNTEYDNGVRRGLAIAIVKATQLLEKEREDIKHEMWKAIVQYQIARKDMSDVINEAPEWFDQYFNETYKK